MLENIIIFLAVFLIIMWLQHNDDLRFKNSKKRVSLYELSKLPLFVASLVLLLKNINYQQCYNELQAIFIVPSSTSNIQPSIMPSSSSNNIIPEKNVFNNIFNEQPDF